MLIILFSSLCNDLPAQYVLPLRERKKKLREMKGIACFNIKNILHAEGRDNSATEDIQ